MRKLARLSACLLVLAFPAITVTEGALAKKGPKPSAGDNQYIDPLANTTTTASTPTRTTGGTPTAPATTPSSTLSQTPPSAATTTTAPSSATAPTSTAAPTTTTSARSLPFTGLNLGTLVLLGVGLLAGGLLLRLIARRLSPP
jgi:hypothetical protein